MTEKRFDDTDIEKLSDEELVRMNMGTFDSKGGVSGIVGNAGITVIMDVLRCEFGYQGITMTDWTIKGYAGAKDSIYPAATAPNTIMAGNDLFMPGSRDDFAEVMEAFKSRKVTRKQLERNATRTSRMAKQLSNT